MIALLSIYIKTIILKLTMDYNNPYELLIYLREKKILFKYLETSGVYLEANNEWVITGETEEGFTSINLLSTDILRISLPIIVEEPIPNSALEKLLFSLQENIEGILLINLDSTNKPIIQYLIHTTIDGLDMGLLKFIQDKKNIFNSIENSFNALSRMSNSIKQEDNLNPINSVNKDGHNSSVWNVIENIDKQSDEDENENEEEDET